MENLYLGKDLVFIRRHLDSTLKYLRKNDRYTRKELDEIETELKSIREHLDEFDKLVCVWKGE